jgi:glycosyltransferase involved in cell wall biosynthesis
MVSGERSDRDIFNAKNATRADATVSQVAKAVLCVQPVAERGGSDQALLRLARQLAGAGWEVHVAVPGPPLLDFSFATVHIVPMRRISTSHSLRAWLAYAWGWPGSVARLWRLARRVDLVQSNSLHSWYGWAAAWLAGKPHLWHAREIVTQSSAALRLERFLVRHFAVQVLAVSSAVAAQFPGANVKVVREEADASEYSPARAGRARARFGLEDSALTVGYVGRIDTWKGIDVFLDAYTDLARRHPGVAAVIAGGNVAGKEGYARDLAGRASEIGVRWLGALSGSDAADLLADLDCLAYPSTEPEPWGLSVVEALACGTPVVATEAGGLSEILAGLPPTAGALVAPADPAALSAALEGLLPPSTNAAARRARPVLRSGAAPPYPEIFETAAASLARCPRSPSRRP